MKLTEEELTWIDTRFKYYDVKFVEIKNELLDHIITAIEAKKENGDQSSLDEQFSSVVDEHFGGYQGIENVAVQQQALFRKQIHQCFGRASGII